MKEKLLCDENRFDSFMFCLRLLFIVKYRIMFKLNDKFRLLKLNFFIFVYNRMRFKQIFGLPITLIS